MTMYPEHRLDTPPPASRFRRPWSPDPYDPLPSSAFLGRHDTDDFSIPGQYPERRREPSDVSVEALDLADYAKTLNRRNNDPHPQPAFRAYDPYPPSPRPLRPLASRDSLTPSASASHSRSPAPIRRPFSLPAPTFPSHSFSNHPSVSNHSNSRPAAQGPNAQEIDIGHFPAFTRGWYGNESPQNTTTSPTSFHGHSKNAATPNISPFDPTFPTHAYDSDLFSASYPYSPPPSYPYRYGPHSPSSRDHGMVPWGDDFREGDQPVDPDTKEERIRMLEREFCGKQGLNVEESERTVGGVDEKGKLITEGPKKRLAVRWLEALLSLTASISSIYTALIIKPAGSPPPSKKLPVYVLYVLSVLTFLGITYLFLIYPCCCGARRHSEETPFTEGPGGIMVLPVQGLPGGNKHGKGGKKKKGGGEGGEGVQVNLIVDPTMFGGGNREQEDEDDGSDMPFGSHSSSAGRRRRAPRRRGIFAGLAMEAQWKRARKMLKWGMAVDMVVMLLWGTEFVLILLGQRCPSGSFDGWCDAYNIATAAACLLCLAFGFSIFFDIKDLHASGTSPRTRT